MAQQFYQQSQKAYREPVEEEFDREVILNRLRTIREAVEDLERMLERPQGAGSPYTRRRSILETIYQSEGMDKDQLLRLLREHGTQYQWIGMQVKKEYLNVIPLPGSRTRYTVTPKAVKDLHLDQNLLWKEER